MRVSLLKMLRVFCIVLFSRRHSGCWDNVGTMTLLYRKLGKVNGIKIPALVSLEGNKALADYTDLWHLKRKRI